MGETTKQTTFKATVLYEAGEWVAHCLDLDIVSTGATDEAAMQALAEAMGLQLAYARAEGNYGHLFRPAPAEAWQKLNDLMSRPHQTRVVPIDDSNSGVNLLEAKVAA